MAIPLQVLIVEDSESDAALVIRLLQQAGYDTQHARVDTAEDMQAALMNSTWDIVLSDYSMPAFDAPRALAILQATQLDIPFIVVSGGIGEDIAVQLMKSGAHDYVMKDKLARLAPAVVRELRDAVSRRERVQVKLALLESQERYEALTSTSMDGFWVVDETGRLLEVNDAYCAMSGYSRSQLVGMHISELEQVEWPDPGTEGESQIESADWSHFETQHRRADGSPLDLAVNVTALRSRNYMIALFTDITERKAAERARVDAAIRWKFLIEQSRDGIVILNLEGQVVEANKSYADMLGYSVEEIRQLHVWDWDIKWSSEQLLKIISTVDAEGIHFETQHQRKDGCQLEVQISANGAVCGGQKLVFCVCRDVTERKLAQEALLRSETRFRTLYDSSSDAVMLVDDSGFFDCNESALRMFQCLSKDEFYAMQPADFSPAYQHCGTDSTLLSQSHIKQAMSEGSLRFEWMHKRVSTQEVFPAEVLLSRLYLDGRNVVQATVRDITERKQAEVELRQAQKLEGIGQLAAGIAHEINTPMQYVSDNTVFLKDSLDSLLNYAAMLEPLMEQVQAKNVDHEAVNRAVDIARQIDISYLINEIPPALEQTLEGIGRVTNIVRAMKEFSHPGSNEKSLIDLNKAIESTVTIARNEWKYVADVQTDLDPELPFLNCFAGDINQVILNLITNSAHSIAEVVRNQPGGKGLITISTQLRANQIELRVGDTGAGIPEAIKERVFEPFFTTKEIGKGTGQGLALAYAAIVRRHNGSISFEPNTGQGTTFIIHLPLASAIWSPQ